MIMHRGGGSVKEIFKNKWQTAGVFILFLGMYTLVDNLDGGYVRMLRDYSLMLIFVNIIANVLMSAMTTYLMMSSIYQYKIIGKETKSQNFGFLSILFGILTYGCTPCVIAFFASVGVTFSVITLPWMGFPYKMMSIGLLVLGIWFSSRELKKSCKISI